MLVKDKRTMKPGLFRVRKVAVITALLAAAVVMSSSFRYVPHIGAPGRDSVASVQAFMKVYSVLMSPRCVNCHPAGDVPLQGDNSQLHAMLPRRGADGKGMYAMKCANCHQAANTQGLHTPPGNPDWHLPPADMKMVFQGKTPRELALQLTNPATNGKKDKKKLLEHVDDGLVLAGWNPGEGRTLPPMSHADFKKAWITWIENGAYAPAR